MFADTFRFWHRTIGTFASIFGFVSNGILLAFVLRSRHPVKQVFIQMAFVDVTFLIVTAMTEPLIILNNGNEIVLQNGYFRHLPNPLNHYMLCIWVFGLYFSICSICVQFIFRYFVLCKNYTVSNYTLFTFLLIPIILSIGMAWLFHAGFIVDEKDLQFATDTLRELLLEDGENTVHAGAVSRNDNIFLLYLALCAVMLMAANYVIITFCVIKIQARLRHMYPHLSGVNRRIQTQVSHILFVQATSPLIVSIVPLGYLCYVIISSGTAFWSMIVLTMGFSSLRKMCHENVTKLSCFCDKIGDVLNLSFSCTPVKKWSYIDDKMGCDCGHTLVIEKPDVTSHVLVKF